MSFEQFRNITQYGRPPTSSINSSGQVYFNPNACEYFGIEDSKSVEIFFDRQTQEMGFVFHKTDIDGAYRISRWSKSKLGKKGLIFSCRRFLVMYQIHQPQKFLEIKDDVLDGKKLLKIKVSTYEIRKPREDVVPQ